MTYFDDVDGTPADETVTFSFDGATYEVDLASPNAAMMRAQFQVWADAGRRVASQRSRRVTGPDALRPSLRRRESAAIRQWARGQGHQIADSGRLPVALVDAFYESQSQRPHASTR